MYDGQIYYIIYTLLQQLITLRSNHTEEWKRKPFDRIEQNNVQNFCALLQEPNNSNNNNKNKIKQTNKNEQLF